MNVTPHAERAALCQLQQRRQPVVTSARQRPRLDSWQWSSSSFAACSLMGLALLTLCHPAAHSATPPNVLLIISDDQAFHDYGFMGHEALATPHLDRLAEESLLFTRGYVPASLCRPSLASIITGLYPHQHGITGNDPPQGVDRRQMLRHVRRWDTLPELLAPLGYQSLQTGKWWEGAPQLAGFTHAMTHGDPQRGGRHGDQGLKISREGLQPVTDFLNAVEGQPFFIWHAPFLPHTPHNPPDHLMQKYLDQDPRRPRFVSRYYAMVEWFDETCGELLQLLAERGLRENTIVVYVTDNGWIQSPDSPRYAARSKRSPNEGGLRTPIMIRYPDKVTPGSVEVPVSSIDLMPTILQLCGADVPSELPGRDLLQVAARPDDHSRPICGATYDHDVADLDQPTRSLQYRWIVQDRWKLIVSANRRLIELYQIVDDPLEQHDVALQYPQQVERLLAELDQWWPGTN